jgi:ADP-heptose:LPS heptosyltransferase
MTKVLGHHPKIIATVRSTADCAASFVRVAKPNDVSEFLRSSQLIQHLKSSYAELKNGYDSAPNNILFIDYDDLIQSPQEQLNLIHKFLGLDPFEYDFGNIDTKVVAEKDDAAWGIPNLHTISPRLGYQHNQDSRKILAQHFDSYDQPKFWKGEVRDYKKKKIDHSVALSMKGEFGESYKLLCEAQKENPLCNKIAFNMGWYALRQGRLQEGMEGLARGRYENCFGNPRPPVPTPMWDGKSMGTILYYLEGGIGDQIHALKYIKDMNRRGCDIIVACSAELFPIVKCCIGVKMIIEHSAAGGVYHDFWVPAMSVLIPLGYEYKDINGSPYIPKTNSPKNKRPVIGVRWQGNPKFEHEQNRRFPLKSFFDALKNIDADFICLQRDAGEEDCPEFIKKVPLNNWEQTRDAISGCDLVISSCTSVAHLAGAMGVPTWIIVPVLNYYIWSVPGDKSPYYDSVKLFRQKKFGCWKHPISELKKNLEGQFGIVKKSKWSKLCQSILG